VSSPELEFHKKVASQTISFLVMVLFFLRLLINILNTYPLAFGLANYGLGNGNLGKVNWGMRGRGFS